MITSHEFTLRSTADDPAVLYIVGFRVFATKATAGGRSTQRVFRAYASPDFWETVLLPALIGHFGPYFEIFDARSRTKIPAQTLLTQLQAVRGGGDRTETGQGAIISPVPVSQAVPAPDRPS